MTMEKLKKKHKVMTGYDMISEWGLRIEQECRWLQLSVEVALVKTWIALAEKKQ